MAAPPSGNLFFQSTSTGVDTFPVPVPDSLGSGFDQAGAQVVVDDPTPGTLDVVLQVNMAPDNATPEPDWVDVIGGGVTGLAAAGTTTLGGSSQLIQAGHGRRMRMLVTPAGGVPAAVTVSCYVSSIGAEGS